MQPAADSDMAAEVAQAAPSADQPPPTPRRGRRVSEPSDDPTTIAPPPAPSGAAPAPLKRVVFRLSHAPAMDVAKTINEILSGERRLSQVQHFGTPGAGAAPSAPSPKLVVVAEPISNSIVVSGAALAVDEIAGVVRELDRRPRMATIEVLIAETLEKEGEQADATAKPPAAKPEAGKAAIEGLSPQSRFTVAELRKLGAGEAASEVRGRLRDLEKSGRLEVLARPQLTAPARPTTARPPSRARSR